MNNREAFEAWTITHGGLDLTMHAAMDNEKLPFPCTYYSYTTEIAWRAFANKKEPAQVALASQAQQTESQDVKRLDFVLSKMAFVEVVRFDDTFNRYKLMSQNEDEEFFYLHDENKSFATEREAIDAAMLFIPPAPEGGE